MDKSQLRHDLVTWKHKFEQAQAELDKVDLESAFGDGYYEGFIEAKNINDKEGELLEDYKAEDILILSEHAESESRYPATKELAK